MQYIISFQNVEAGDPALSEGNLTECTPFQLIDDMKEVTFNIALLNLAYALLVVDEYSAKEGLNATSSSEFSLQSSEFCTLPFRPTVLN